MQLEDLSKLSPAERLNAMEILWQSFSLDADLHKDIVPEWHRHVLASRLHQLQTGLETTLPWEQAKERLVLLARDRA
jgi:putative addiction module component (TIGR02574 family)